MVLLIPAFCAFIFHTSSRKIEGYWLAFWTVSLVAFWIHFYIAVHVFFDGDWQLITSDVSRHLVAIPTIDTVVAIWWTVDVLLAWTIRPDVAWIRFQRITNHFVVFALFILGSTKEGHFRGSWPVDAAVARVEAPPRLIRNLCGC